MAATWSSVQASIEEQARLAWADLTHHRFAIAARRASNALALFPKAQGMAPDRLAIPCQVLGSELVVTFADLLYILGAATANDESVLRDALKAYDSYLTREPHSVNALRMRAETLLRLRRYEEAFASFGQVWLERRRLYAAEGSDRAAEAVEVAPFRLRHDAARLSYIVRTGAPLPSGAGEGEAARVAVNLLALAEELERQAPPGAGAGAGQPEGAGMVAADAGGGGRTGRVDKYGRSAISAYPRPLRQRLRAVYSHHLFLAGMCEGAVQEPPAAAMPRPRAVAPAPACPLSDTIDWPAVHSDYGASGTAVVNDFFSPPALAELQDFARRTPAFRTVRAGFLGAFPADGCTHPAILACAHALEAALPCIFGPHPLGLWWLFKYTDAAPQGIGIHADAAAVNVNVWLTDDGSRVRGGGLRVYEHVPAVHGAAVSAFNREFASSEEEDALREELRRQGREDRIDYACNRAVIFRSDRYHESEPFEFVPGYEHHRINLTLLFGDRLADAEFSSGRDGGLQAKLVASDRLPQSRLARDTAAVRRGRQPALSAPDDAAWGVFD